MGATEPQAILTPLTEAAIFLVVTVDAGGEDAVARAARGRARAAAVGRVPHPRGRADVRRRRRVGGLGSAVRRAASGGAAPVPGVRGRASRRGSPRRATCCSTSAPTAWTSASSSRSGSTSRLAGCARVVDEVHGFRSFDERDLLGFVDGTENPEGAAAAAAVLDRRRGPGVRRRQLRHRAEVRPRPRRAGTRCAVEEQERAVGRTKLVDIELADEVKPANSHVALNTIVDEDGTRASDRALQHAVRPRRRGRVRHLFHRLRPHPGGDRADADATCSSASRPATTTASSTSRPRSPGTCSSCRRSTSSRTRDTSPPDGRQLGRRDARGRSGGGRITRNRQH